MKNNKNNLIKKASKNKTSRIAINKYKCRICKKPAVSFLNCKPYCQKHFTENKKTQHPKTTNKKLRLTKLRGGKK